MSAIRLDIDGAIARLVLNRPDKRNALNLAMWRAIPGLVAQAAQAHAVRLLVIEGAGDHFAAGADIAEFETTYATREAALENQTIMAAAMSAIEDFPKPSLAAIRGACVGGGCGIALCADLRFAQTGARLGITPGKLGLAYGVADTRRLVQAVGLSKAKDILFTGRLLDVKEAALIGLVDRVSDDVSATVAAFAAEIVAAAPFTATATKQILRMLRDGATSETPESRALFASAFEGDDFKEGFRAFKEKRAPRFA